MSKRSPGLCPKTNSRPAETDRGVPLHQRYPLSTRLEHKTALVTGATSNIGRAIATAFAREQAHVVVSGRSERRGLDDVEEIRAAGGRADFIAADLDGSAKASRDLAAEAVHTLGGHIDILVSSAVIPASGQQHRAGEPRRPRPGLP
jgi:NAD(P)-dependent dehydrogenase (short-subunit alcohol dehydrogenase family)